jgi:hypothetical protein
MPLLAHYALIACVVASGVGALIMCLLVLAYGFNPAEEPPPLDGGRRWLITRVGHAAAGACFAITAILALVVLARSSSAPAAVTSPGPSAEALQARLDAVAAGLSGVETRMTRVESRVGVTQAGARKPASDPAPARARARAATAAVTPSAPTSAPAEPPVDLKTKLQRDGEAIKRAFQTAGEHLKVPER